MNQSRLFQSVAEQIVQLIEGGAFPPGAKLPGERELADRFGVSRVTVREAEVALQAQGRLVIRAGSGVYVSDPQEGRGRLPDASAFELTEARCLFESEAAALAASIISDGDLDKLAGLVADMRDDGRADDADREFHLTIAAASGNRVIQHTIEELWRMRSELPQVRSTHEGVCIHDGGLRVAEHEPILAAMRERDAVGARLAMRKHFNRLLEAMLDRAEETAMSEVRRQASESRERFLITVRQAS
jgi:DNA-binding FadR family transcriptional regulator